MEIQKKLLSNKYIEICTISRPQEFVEETGSYADEITKHMNKISLL